jgi:hypothetical protein
MKLLFPLLAIAALMLSVPCYAEPNLGVKFKITVENLSDFDLSPGGYVIHPESYRLFDIGQTAAPPVKALCESGVTPDFLYYVRKEAVSGQAFSFNGGVKAKSKVDAYFRATTKNGYLSFLHKVTFTDDTCVGQDSVALFSKQGDPMRTEVALFPLDTGTRENLKTSVPRNEMLAQFSWSYWKSQDTIPAAPISASPFLKHIPIARVIIEPVE